MVEQKEGKVDGANAGQAQGGLAWRKAVPSRWNWLSILCGLSCYPLLLSLIAVVLAKYGVMNHLQSIDTGMMTWLSITASDFVLHLGLIGVFALGESRLPRLVFITVPLAFVVSLLAVVNALYLQIGGEQLTWEALSIGIERSSEVFGILGVEDLITVGRVLVFLMLVGIPVLATFTLRTKPKYSVVEVRRGRAKIAGWVFIIALCIRLVTAESEFIALRTLQGNATLATYSEWAFGEETQSVPTGQRFSGYDPILLSSPQAVQEFVAKGERPNVLWIVLESVRWDMTSLGTHNAKAKTPHLEALAKRGTLATQARAVMPHTSKSLFSMLCGRLPMMQRRNDEALSAAPIQCLPELLAQAGYNSVFMQTALGTFEDRPRLIERLGYQEFLAWENTQGAPAGYLASDDESLVPAMESWLAKTSVKTPFFATLLTSATHHPYELVGKAAEQVEGSGAPSGSAQERYARLIEAQDVMLGKLLALLEEKGLLESTIVVVTGDHGEGFGSKGVRQHDNNFYEEGLHVPLVLAGPGVPQRRIDKNVSLVDLPFSVMEILGITPVSSPQSRLPIDSIYATANASLARPFACYFGGYCYGYVQEKHKVFVAKGASEGLYFDLETDPQELRARSATEAMQEELNALFGVIANHHSDETFVSQELVTPLGEWRCAINGGCWHPKSPQTMFFPK